MNALIEAPSLFVYFASFSALGLALVVLLSKNPIASAVALMGTLFSTAGLYFALGNFFLGAVQILVYAGAIAVLFVFIVMLLDLKPHALRFTPGRKPFLILAGSVAVVAAAVLLFAVARAPSFGAATGGPTLELTARDSAAYFISHYHAAFQAAGLLVFGAILGAIVLARGHLGRKPS